jgi:hypothetical protein
MMPQLHKTVGPNSKGHAVVRAQILLNRALLVCEEPHDVSPPDISKVSEHSSVSNSEQYSEEISGNTIGGSIVVPLRQQKWGSHE